MRVIYVLQQAVHALRARKHLTELVYYHKVLFNHVTCKLQDGIPVRVVGSIAHRNK